MIVEDGHSIWLLFPVSGSILPAILPKIAAAVAVGAIFSLISDTSRGSLAGWDEHFVELPAFTVFGIALSLFLGFRNSACYAKWIEYPTLS